MKNILLFTFALILSAQAKSQFTQSDLIYYVGSGPDTAICVVDFLDGTVDTSYAWGFLFDAGTTVTAEDMLNAIGADEPKMDFAMSGGFLNDITYNAHAGISGSPNWWGTWSRTELTVWASNAGIGEVLANGDWFGCSYTDFGPAIEPGEPLIAYQSIKFDMLDIRFWVGLGADSAVMVLDFVSDQYGEQVSYAWGYLFDGTTDGTTMLADIDAADVNLKIVTGGGFLNDIYFNDLKGVAGTPDYWGTWSGTNLSDWTMNAGLATTINPGDWYGATYAPWEPRRPYYPNPAQDSLDFMISHLESYTYYGTGPDTAVIVIDFNESAVGESYAFGFLFDAANTVTAEDAIVELEATSAFTIGIGGGFLNDITYHILSGTGIGGSPNYWSTWSSSNNGGWYMNAGLTEVLSNHDWFGCSYTAWNPATFPSAPENGLLYIGIEEIDNSISVYPNPTSGSINIQIENNADVSLYDINGRKVMSEISTIGTISWDLSLLEAGVYSLVSVSEGVVSNQKIIKQ